MSLPLMNTYNNPEYYEFITNIKEGDEIILAQPGGWSGGWSNYKIVKVKKVTPTGIIKLENNSATFDSIGRERGKSGSWSRSQKLFPLTKELEEYKVKTQLINSLRKHIERKDLTYLSVEDLETLIKITKPKENKNENN